MRRLSLFFRRSGIPAAILFAAVLVCLTASGQHPPMKDITDSMKLEFPRVRTSWGTHKKMPEAFERQIYFALSYFPEFKKTRIRFELKKGEGIIATRPTWGSIFRRSSKRTYIVVISDSLPGRGYPLWTNGTVNGQVGILGHELCHILYFRKRNGTGLVWLGIRHISKKYMDGFENRTDSVDIVRGLGYQLIDWNRYLRHAFGIPMGEGTGTDPFQQNNKRERYMSPASIRRVMAGIPAYRQM